MKKLLLLVSLTLILCAQSVSAYDTEAVKLYNAGIDLFKEEKYQKAVSNFYKAVSIDPSFIDAYYNLGVVEKHLGRNERALEAFQEVLNIIPDDYEVMLEIADIHLKNGDREKAIKIVEKIPETSPNYTQAQELALNIIDQENIAVEKEEAKLEAIAEQENTSEEKDLLANTQKEEEKKEAQTTEAANEEAEKVAVNDSKTDADTVQVNNPVTKEFSTNAIGGFDGPTGIAKDSKGNIYVANYSDNSIVQLTPEGKKRIITKGAPLDGPVGMAVDINDNLYVANYNSNKIVKFPAKSLVPEVMPFQVSQPYFIMIDCNSNLFVSEQGNNTVSKFRLTQ